jgi:type 1 glutamine amidotransferase
MTTTPRPEPRPRRAAVLACAVASIAALSASTPGPATGPAAKAPRPIRALLITGGCCHDYKGQKTIIPEGVSARARVEWTVIHEEETSKDHKASIYSIPGWAEGYDVVVHNECFGAVSDREFVEKVVGPHREGVPAVVIHCAMHTFRALETDEWRECLGVTSRRHGRQHPLEVKNLKPDHPVMKGFPPSWATGNEELYWIEKVWPNTIPLAQAKAREDGKDHPVVWAHTFGKVRVFGTTLAHHDATMRDPVYLDLLTRGLLWACDRLGDDGKPQPSFEADPARGSKGD